jgi:hypothetical protein
MIASVSFAKQNGKKNQNVNGDATVVQVGSFNKSLIDQTGATGGGWYYAQGSGTDATIKVYGNGNNTAITQVGQKNVAGQDIHVNFASACMGFFDISNVGDPVGGSYTINTCAIDLACCQSIDAGSYKVDFKPIDAGIFVLGNDNKASISQYGDYMLAGIKIVGSDNEASITQAWGSHNGAFVNIDGDANKSIVAQYGVGNAAMVQVEGDNNTTGAHQTGFGNVLAQKVHGDNNTVIARQGLFGFSSYNEAIQKVCGTNNTVLLEQYGFGNKSVQETSGMNHNSVVTQMGMMNQSAVLQ